MWDIKTVKQIGREAFKRNYWSSVAAGFLLMLLASGTSASINSQTQNSSAVTDVTNAYEALSPEAQQVVIAAIFTGVLFTIVVSLLLKIFVFNPLEVGCYHFFKKNINDSSTKLGTVLEGFGNYGHVFGTLFLRDLFIALFALLLVIPGIMKSYSYRMVPFIVKDHPELSASQTLALSSKMMQGNRWQSFVLDLSFVGWFLLGLVTLNLGNIFWAQPYHASTNAALYLELSKQY